MTMHVTALCLALLVGCVADPPPVEDAAAISLPPAAYPIEVVAHAACVHDGRIYVAGGYADGVGFVDRVWCYDPEANVWHARAPLPAARAFHVMVAAADRLWVCGGLTKGERGDRLVSTVLAYDPDADAWETVGEMPAPRSRLAAGVLDDRVYVVGGYAAGDSNRVDVFDPTTRTWTTGPDLPVATHGHALARITDRLVMAGGSSTGTSTFVLRAGATTWEPAGELPDRRLFAGATAVDGVVYLMGNRAYGAIPLLTFEAGRWQAAAPDGVRTHRTAVVALDGRIFVIGGENHEGGQLRRVSRYDIGARRWEHSRPGAASPVRPD